MEWQLAIGDEERRNVGYLLSRQRKGDPLAAAADSVLETGACANAKLLADALLNCRRHWTTRALAAWSLGAARLEAAQRTVALEALSTASFGRLPLYQGRMRKPLFYCQIAGILASLAAGLAFGPPWVVSEMIPFGMGLGVVLSIVLIPVHAWLDDATLKEVRGYAVRALGRLREPTTVSGLARVCQMSHGSLQDAARAALYNSLPMVTPALYGTDSDLTPHLLRLIEWTRGSFRLLLLDALEAAGDGRAVAPLEVMLSDSVPGANGELQTRIQEILPVLRERREREKHSSRLLRPADGQDTGLLRPASGAGERDADNLLRPVGRE